MKYGSLFSGIGGFEYGLGEEYAPLILNEIDPAAKSVLKSRFPSIQIYDDVTTLTANQLDSIDLLLGGFPCQDVSIVGGQKGIGGTKTPLVKHIFRLVEDVQPDWILLENVQSIRFVHSGRVLNYVVQECERLGYSWAYRVLDSNAFGLPQRRRRWYFVASKVSNPSDVLFSDFGSEIPKVKPILENPIGFYWTEGRRGHGLTNNAIPPLKAGSTIGIPSPPAVLFPNGSVVLPTIKTAERLQGFEEGWTETAPVRDRWRLVGNAVSPPVISWIANRMKEPRIWSLPQKNLSPTSKWPYAAYSTKPGIRNEVQISETPSDINIGLLTDNSYTWNPISLRAISGFISRARASSLRYPPGFLEKLEYARDQMGN